jgi:hypothetical protein
VLTGISLEVATGGAPANLADHAKKLYGDHYAEFPGRVGLWSKADSQVHSTSSASNRYDERADFVALPRAGLRRVRSEKCE